MGKIRKFFDQGSAETLVYSFVTSKSDYCNAPLFGLPKYRINRLQLVVKYCLKNEQECIIRFQNSKRSRELLHLIIHDCEFFEQLIRTIDKSVLDEVRKPKQENFNLFNCFFS